MSDIKLLEEIRSEQVKNNNVKTADSITPLYLRKSQAERMKQKNG